ncbi:MAG: heparinase II/III family protein, partial [Armatimonadota bacterium]|nr:heparinase II/III family protein [Armatimonadota bacterium]
LRGFTPDGYCSEGLGYWNYGFGHYVLLAETIRQATGGKLDLFALPAVKAPATFGTRIQIIEGIAPAFADCSVNAAPASPILWYANLRFGLGLADYQQLDLRDTLGSVFEAMVYFTAQEAPRIAAAAAPAGPEIRSWFDHAGVLIGRPAPGSPCRMGVALKGGHNAEHHNHNDVGSYVVVVGERAVLLDPGAETYSARTFSSRRYESKLLNSYGHPVPVVAGQLQRAGADAKAAVLQADFTNQTDTLRLDLTSAYPVPDLQRLERTFIYSREGEGSLTITDRVDMKSPQTFGTALITRGTWQRQPDGSLLITDVDQAVRVAIDAGGAEYALQAEEIREDAPVRPTRIGINLAKPVTAATITLTITPAAAPGMPENGSLLRNGGFEFGALGWEIPADGISSLSTERAASGTHSLKIADNRRDAGSNVSSARFRCGGPGDFVIRGKAFHVSGEGVGIYVRYLNARGRMLNEVDANGNMAAVGSLTPTRGEWAPFAFPFRAPEGTVYLQVWIHSFNAAVVEAYLDDLEILRQ